MTGQAWSFHNPVHVHFGCGAIEDLPGFVRGKRPLLVTTPGFTRRGGTDRVRQLLAGSNLIVRDTVAPNPTLQDLLREADSLRSEPIDEIIALGGGSVIDTAKALSVLLVEDDGGGAFERRLKQGQQVEDLRAIPVIAVPTTSGTGSEVTPFATVWDGEAKKKYSLAGKPVFPRVALLDPLLTLDLPMEVTVSTGLDAISQALESVWNRNASPITTLYATRSLQVGLRALPELVHSPQDVRLRADMMQASLLAGMAISNTRTALAHSMSYPMTARYGVPHGIACALTLPALLRFNAEVDDGRIARLANVLGYTSVSEMRIALSQLLQKLGVKGLMLRHIRSVNQLIDLIPEMYTPGRADNNLRSANPGDIQTIIEEAWSAMDETA